MKIRLRYFASIREIIGSEGEDFHTSAATLAQLRDELIARGGSYTDALARGRAVRMALNQTMAAESAALCEGGEGAEIAFFPPVTGG